MAHAISTTGSYEFKVVHLFAGMGGGSLGFKNARYAYKGIMGRFRNLVGIDINASALKDYERLTGSQARVMDLFSREQYIVFHGKLPPDGWKEVTPDEILEATGGEYPDVVFSSPPCKGLSALLPKKSAESPKYQALNRLVVRGIKLTLEAFSKNLPSLILIENVPRITTRGKALLDEIKGLLSNVGYVFHEGFHDCGEYGGLGQHRRRYLLIARLPEKLPMFVYKPYKKKVKSIGEILSQIPLPDDPSMGVMHRLPRLKWKTWVRLALIPPGGDWRDLQEFAADNPDAYHKGKYAIMPWDEPSNGESFIQNVRIPYPMRGGGPYGVQEWDKSAATVIGNSKINGSNASCVADVRMKDSEKRHPNVYRIVKWDETSPCVTGTRFGSGALAVADMRVKCQSRPGLMGVADWDKPISTISGKAAVTSSNCVAAVADHRFGCKMRAGNFLVQNWEKPSQTVYASADVHSGAAAVADPMIRCKPRAGAYGVHDMEKPAVTISGSLDIHQGCAAVADNRIPEDISTPHEFRIPDDNEKLDPPPILISPWGFWHRPLTTLELAALQGFPVMLEDGSPLVLDGKSDAKWREKIGNAVPPPAAEAIAEYMLQSLVANKCGDLLLSFTEVWVDKEEGDFSVQLIHKEVNANGPIMSEMQSRI